MNDKGLSDEEVYEACKDGDPMTKVRLIMVFLLFFHAFFFPNVYAQVLFICTGHVFLRLEL